MENSASADKLDNKPLKIDASRSASKFIVAIKQQTNSISQKVRGFELTLFLVAYFCSFLLFYLNHNSRQNTEQGGLAIGQKAGSQEMLIARIGETGRPRRPDGRTKQGGGRRTRLA